LASAPLRRESLCSTARTTEATRKRPAASANAGRMLPQAWERYPVTSGATTEASIPKKFRKPKAVADRSGAVISATPATIIGSVADWPTRP